MTDLQWTALKLRIDGVFEELSRAGLVVLQSAGYTQSDGFDDCSQIFMERGAESSGLHGFCFYTLQDLGRAKGTGQLLLAYWGAPEGSPPDMLRVANLVVDTFRRHGFEVQWDGQGTKRPIVMLPVETTASDSAAAEGEVQVSV